MEVNYEGIVSSIKVAPDRRNNVYTILSTKAINAKSRLLLELGDVVLVKSIEDDVIESVETKGKTSKEDYEKRIAHLVRSLQMKQNIEGIKEEDSGKAYGRAFADMSNDIQEACETFARAYISGAPVIVRFHHDGDGSSGAVSLYRALSKIDENIMIGRRGISWVMHRGVEYDPESFYADCLEMKNFESMESPLVLIIDFGTAPGSEHSISESSKKFKLLMLDHHPMYKGFPKEKTSKYINPWEYGSDTNFNAGLLASLFAESLCRVHTQDMRTASMISDFSSYADRKDKAGMHDAVILDYLTNVAGRPESGIAKLTPSYIDSVLKNKERADEIFYTASSTMNEMLDLGVRSVKSYRCGKSITAFVLEFGLIPKNDLGYPLPGRYSSRLQERLEEINGMNTITVLHYGSYVTIRMSKEISGAVGILKIIDRLVKESEYVESGGGHNEAASIKVKNGQPKKVVDLLLIELGAKL